MGANYKRGRTFEYRAKRDLERRGYVVVRSAGSRTPADLVAGREGQVLLVQCTTSSRSKDEKDRAGLREMAERFGAEPVLVWKDGLRGPLVWETLREGFACDELAD